MINAMLSIAPKQIISDFDLTLCLTLIDLGNKKSIIGPNNPLTPWIILSIWRTCRSLYVKKFPPIRISPG